MLHPKRTRFGPLLSRDTSSSFHDPQQRCLVLARITRMHASSCRNTYSYSCLSDSHFSHFRNLQSEQQRIEDCGGCVLIIGGCHRVNGRLAVSRAIGDNGLKDVVIGEPDVMSIPLNGNEDFLLMACDGLWDFVEEDDIAVMVYEALVQNEGKNHEFIYHLHAKRCRNGLRNAISTIRDHTIFDGSSTH